MLDPNLYDILNADELPIPTWSPFDLELSTSPEPFDFLTTTSVQSVTQPGLNPTEHNSVLQDNEVQQIAHSILSPRNSDSTDEQIIAVNKPRPQSGKKKINNRFPNSWSPELQETFVTMTLQEITNNPSKGINQFEKVAAGLIPITGKRYSLATLQSYWQHGGMQLARKLFGYKNPKIEKRINAKKPQSGRRWNSQELAKLRACVFAYGNGKEAPSMKEFEAIAIGYNNFYGTHYCTERLRAVWVKHLKTLAQPPNTNLPISNSTSSEQDDLSFLTDLA